MLHALVVFRYRCRARLRRAKTIKEDIVCQDYNFPVIINDTALYPLRLQKDVFGIRINPAQSDYILQRLQIITL
jgi:hypothetical protein